MSLEQGGMKSRDEDPQQVQAIKAQLIAQPRVLIPRSVSRPLTSTLAVMLCRPQKSSISCVSRIPPIRLPPTQARGESAHEKEGNYEGYTRVEQPRYVNHQMTRIP